MKNNSSIPPTKSKTEWVEIEPVHAQRWLSQTQANVDAKTFKQRQLSPRFVSQYASDMSNDNWVANGAPIIISNTGNIIDGQHRLRACVAAGVPFKTLLITGVIDESISDHEARRIRDTIDIGRTRSIASNMKLVHGMKDSYSTTAIFRRIASLHLPADQCKLSPAQIMAMMEVYGRSIDLISPYCRPARLKNATVKAPLVVYAAKYPEDALRFVTDLRTMSNLQVGDPVLALFNWMNVPNRNKNLTGVAIARALAAFHTCQQLRMIKNLPKDTKSILWLREINEEAWSRVCETTPMLSFGSSDSLSRRG